MTADGLGRTIRRIRQSGWAVLLICFVLPYGRGCLAIDVPYKQAFTSPGQMVSVGLPFLYPVLLFGGWLAFRAIPAERVKRAVRVLLYLGGFGLLTWLLGAAVGALYQADRNLTAFDSTVALVSLFLWSVMAFGHRRVQEDAVLTLVAFEVSALSLGLLVIQFIIAEDKLIGAWASLIAGAAVVASYIVGYVGRGRIQSPAAP